MHEIYDNVYQDASDTELEKLLSMDIEHYHHLTYNIDPHMILNDVRNTTISYTSTKRKVENQTENDILNRLIKLQDKSSSGYQSQTLVTELAETQQQYNAWKTKLTSTKHITIQLPRPRERNQHVTFAT